MIYTLTLNPTLDLVVEVDHLRLGSSREGEKLALDPGGRGLNVSRVLTALGAETLALGVVGGYTGEYLMRRVAAEGVPCDFLQIPGETRLDLFIVEHGRDERTTTVKQRGPLVPPDALARLKKRLHSIPSGSLLVLGGSLPPGIPPSFYREIIEELKPRGVRSVLDSRGQPLAEGILAIPTVVKPNEEEAAALLARTIQTEEEAIEAARLLHARGIFWVVISRGAHGAVGVSDEGVFRAIAPQIEEGSTVGAGDSMVACLALGLEQGYRFPDALRLGVAAGTATTLSPGTSLCTRESVDSLIGRVVVEQVQPSPTQHP